MDTATTKVWVSVAHVPGSTEGAITPHGDVMPAETEDVLLNILVSRPHSGQDAATATERGERNVRGQERQLKHTLLINPPRASRQRPSLKSQNKNYPVKHARTGARATDSCERLKGKSRESGCCRLQTKSRANQMLLLQINHS